MAEKIKFSANFKRNYVALFALMMFLLVVIGEIVLAVSIPVYMQREDVMVAETNRLEALQAFDYLRHYCNAIPEKNRIVALEKQLLCHSLDRFAIGLRKSAESLTPEEVARLQKSVNSLLKSAMQLAQGKNFSKDNPLDTAAYINRLLKANN